MNRITAAVKELRKRLGDSQDAFASRLHLSVRAIANYEAGRMPAIAVLVSLMNTADSNGFRDLTTLFQEAVEKELGHGIVRVAPLGSEEEEFSALRCILRYEGSMYKELRAKWMELAEPVKAANRANDFRASVTAGLIQLVQKGLADGLTDEQIMAKAPKADQIALKGILTMTRGMQKLEAERKGDH
ncbi:MAG: family transcriptional regulator [Bryobacterales bacterium]|nr:family transcriptional regulator [Bryobacterales bacterium]